MSDGPSTRQVVRISLSVAGTALALYLIYLLRGVVELVVLGVFVAFWLGPFVEFLTRRHTPRVVAILAAYVTLLGSIVFLGLVAVPPIVSQIEAGVRQLPHGITKLREDSTLRKYDDKYKITPKLESEARKLPGRLSSIAKELSAVTVGAFSAVTKLISVLALAFFLLRDGPQLSGRLYRIRGPDQEERLRRVGTDIYHSVSGYVAGNFAISIIAGLVAYIALTVMGVAFAAPAVQIIVRDVWQQRRTQPASAES